jgi:BirA family biotin operon repressor/biotin-[acetyl-CoA-carboxylase] ligase
LRSSLPDDLRASRDVPFDIQAELLRCGARLGPFARHMHWLETTGSTNTVALRLADLGAPEGSVVAADAQTAGRGRLGRTWFSPPGAGLYVSIVLRPRSELETPALLSFLTLTSGVALAEGIRSCTGLPVEIKWPNDIVLRRRKLAGILAEGAAQGGSEVQHVVVGFGLNLRPAPYPPELADRVTSLEAESGRPVDRAVVLAETLAAFASRYADLQAGRFDAILAAWRASAHSLRSAPVEFDGPSGPVRGYAHDIDDRGALLVRVGSRVERLIAGEVRWL